MKELNPIISIIIILIIIVVMIYIKEVLNGNKRLMLKDLRLKNWLALKIIMKRYKSVPLNLYWSLKVRVIIVGLIKNLTMLLLINKEVKLKIDYFNGIRKVKKKETI